MLPYITIFGKTIGSYAILSILGFFVCTTVVWFQARKLDKRIEDVILILPAIAGGLFLGGHILYGITHLDKLIYLFAHLGDYSWKEIFAQLSMIFGGMVFYGGMFGGIAAVYIYTRFDKTFTRPQALDLYAFSIPLFHVFGRIGCFLGGCCYGIESSFGFLVTNNTISPDINGVTRFPVQLVEAGFNLIIFFIVFWMYRKKKLPGRLLLVYFALYAPVRFTLEFFRGDAIRGILFGLSTSQWISLGLYVFLGIYLLVYFIRKKRKAI